MASVSSVSTVLLLSAIGLALLANLCQAFKSHEFKKCDDSNFCKRNRGNRFGQNFALLDHGGVVDGVYTAKLINIADDSASLRLNVSVYGDGIVRVSVKEEDSRRFEVADVVESDLKLGSFTMQYDESLPNVVLLKSVGCAVRVSLSPFALSVEDSLGVKQVAINEAGFFNFEHRRSKKEGDEGGMWEETFRSHTDSKPNGPEAISLDVTFFETQHVYGIPEHASSMALKPSRDADNNKSISEPYRLYNLDVFEYEADSPFGLYGSVPFMMSHSSSHSSGFFWLNAAEMWVDVYSPPSHHSQPSTVLSQWVAEAGVLDVFLFVSATPKSLLQQYGSVTGRTIMPPLFSIAYHQCRWNYKDEADVTHVDTQFDLHDIPYDVLWLDIEHTDGKKYMTWDSVHFPSPVRMQQEIGSKGRHMVTIVDPHMKRDEGYPLHKESSQKGLYVKDKSGSDFDGWCWPGSSSYLDVISPAIRQWWASKFSYDSYVGSTSILHIWNDMNEPSVFNGPEVTMPKDNLHWGGYEHREVHNLYGYMYHLATVQGLLQRDGGQRRPFVLSRALFAGTQKVGPIWTGDNTADWDHLKVSVPMLLSLGLSGVAFAGADVGGFFGDPNAELMVRWYQLGAFYPFFRGHAHLDTKRREPWLFGEPYTGHIREAIRLRYALLPYIYTLFYEAHRTGIPIMRPLFLEFPTDGSLFAHDHSFMLGPALLVQPITHQGATSVDVLLPGNSSWYHLTTGKAYPAGSSATATIPVDLSTILAFQQAGTIVVRRDRARRSSTQMASDPYTIVVALDARGEASGELYIDDGESYDFQKGAYTHLKLHFSQGRLSSSRLAPSGYAAGSKCLVERIVIFGLKGPVSRRHAIVEGTVGKKVEEEEGPAVLRPGIVSSAVIVRQPNVQIGDEWVIRVVEEVSSF